MTPWCPRPAVRVDKFFYVMCENSLGAWIAAYAELSCLVSAVDAPQVSLEQFRAL